jgi:hypothetical protein
MNSFGFGGHKRRLSMKIRLLVITVVTGCAVVGWAVAERSVVSLDGTWEVGQSVEPDTIPDLFERSAPVPGLLDMAEPAFSEVGKKSELRRYFWYRRVFSLGQEATPSALLKIHKAKYGTVVYLNGQMVGEHLPSFTAAIMDVTPALRFGQENELVIRVGADREVLPAGQPTGWDFEKYLYLPGIYDTVEIILAEYPRIENIQIVPQIESGTVRVITEITNGNEEKEFRLGIEIQEGESAKRVAQQDSMARLLRPNEKITVEEVVPLPAAKLWSPEKPFLYEVRVGTGGDSGKARFGMRQFRMDRGNGQALLNGNPYYLRGSNITIYRFFEDALRGGKPWDRDWVRGLHRKLKSMNWNSLRYCIGFPPDFWYDIADEEGFLIQDEFPIWTLFDKPEELSAEKIIPEYVEWMRERWNHASVVIWDAQNESNTDETGKALKAVRHLDLSNRPWENGWAEPQSPNDTVEAHPYLFSGLWMKRGPFRLSDMAGLDGVPHLMERQKRFQVPIIINEYAWLWLQRDGTPTSLTGEVYEDLLGKESTADQRRELYAHYLAALSEFWRAHRHTAGVLHFCSLGYSRAGDVPRPKGGATSDHFIDLDSLTLEPYFEKYVRDAFNPVGVMVNFWDEEVEAGAQRDIQVYVVNDLAEGWEDQVELRIEKDGVKVQSRKHLFVVAPSGQQVFPFGVTFPREAGEYRLSAVLEDGSGEGVESFRLFRIIEKK